MGIEIRNVSKQFGNFQALSDVSLDIEAGELVALLEDYLPPFAGFYLYFPHRRNMAPKLRALVEHVRSWRREPVFPIGNP